MEVCPMFFSIEFVNDRFDKFNKLIFKGRLPRIPVKLSRSKSSVGMFCTKYKHLSDGSKLLVSRHFSFSKCFDMDEHALEDVIIHEMIHYLINFEGVNDTSPHGKVFRSLMTKINKEFNRNITISTKTTKASVQTIGLTKKWHIIAVMKVRDGSLGIKILPLIADKVAFYYRHVRQSPQINSIRLYIHNAPFFSNYPTSTALKYHVVDEELLRKELTGGQLIYIEGDILKNGKIYNGEELF